MFLVLRCLQYVNPRVFFKHMTEPIVLVGTGNTVKAF
ncbi:unnamed protein product [Acanthoscelides obtectus]|uniref:Uncharacterized protein n=1 Tax=Acanthoscelides obtectus TaxID=200917 RepID=A0A9P0LEH0_ACAOB|nr:unnamed protein product [Acanthoscelides obtectus]CAK1664925.1 hypothetical protein AOBTE_LOCUS24555 [Acanthoscelides obtectus]